MNTPEPPRQTSLDLLAPKVKIAVTNLLAWMVKQGFDPIPYETLRTLARQKWLYGVGRTHDLNRKPVTWTLHSLHLPDRNGQGHACDIISKSKGWNDPAFFLALKTGAAKFGLTTIPQEQCHVQEA